MDTTQTIVTNLKEFALTTSWAFGSTTDTQYIPQGWGAIEDRVPERTMPTANVPMYPYSDLFPESPLLEDTERIFNLYTDPVDDTAGWLSAADPYFADNGITPPEGALYGYTMIPESLLDKAWPCNAVEISFAKVKLLVNGVPLDNTYYLVNTDGLWWMQDGYEYSPLNTVVGDNKTYTVEMFTQIQTGDTQDGVDESNAEFAVGSDELELSIERLGGSCMTGIQTITVFQGQTTTLNLPITDRNGNAVVLDPTLHMLTLVLRHGPAGLPTTPYAMTTLSEDGKVASVRLSIPDAGIYKAQLLVGSISTGNLLHVTNYFLISEPVGSKSNMVTVSDIRMHLMDNCPDENALLLAYEYKDSDIISAMQTACDYYNGFGVRKTGYTVANLPVASRYFFKQGVTALLLRSAAFKFARNELPYSAGGVSINDKSKAPLYLQMSQVLDDEWKDYVSGTKQALNIANSYFVI